MPMDSSEVDSSGSAKPSRFDRRRIEREAALLARSIRSSQTVAESPAERRWRRFRAYRTAISNWARNFWRARAGREDYLPLYFIWTVLRSCNFRCSYCDDHRGRKYPDLDNGGVLDTEQGKRLLRIMRTRTPAVYYAGGEPTLRSDLPELMREAKRLGYFPQVINTNGSTLHRRLVQPEWGEFLSTVDVVIVSLDSLRPGVLARMYRTTAPENVLRNLFALRLLSDEFRFKLMVNCVVQPGHVDDAQDVLDLANELGIHFCGVPQNVGPRAREGLLQSGEYQAFVRGLLSRHREGHRFAGSLRLNERLYQGAPLSCRNTLKPHVDHDGRLFWPCKAMVNREPVMIPVLDHGSIDEIWAAGGREVAATGFHGPGPNQCGASCNWAQNYSTDAYEYGLRHPGSLLREAMDFARN